ncbi:ribosome biogenesis GTP-binding protein YihA/YsxC [Palleronia sp.]|uniref:ribosome biogenesis GTP-binding protein YihA/YsxC n=1 Tax=Palleronia sp. TaxID=1940284 RepID=UPI0035C7F47E
MSLPFPEAEPTSEEIEAGTRLFRQDTEFLKGVVAMDGLPPDDRVEICFAGRSNVGKSSLINALTGRRNIARASNTPGRTQEVNFFTLGSLYLVDLPGYGFANAPLHVVQQWQNVMRAYLGGRANLRRAFLLIDHRHGPKPVDVDIMDLLDKAAVPFQAVLTKSDKVKAADRERTQAALRETLSRHPAAYPEIVVTSSETGDGIDALRAVIAGID